MDDFIELHSFEGNEAFLVNKRNIAYIEPQHNKNGDFCLICTMNTDECWTPVSEDYETVKKMLLSSYLIDMT